MASRSRRDSQYYATHPEEGIKAFFELVTSQGSASSEQPIFIFSAGWRSGSTLLQRLVCSGDKVLVWGEPYDRTCVIQNIATSLAPFSTNWPVPKYYEQPDLSDVSQHWIANLYPRPEHVLRGYQAFFQETFARPAYALGAQRWGLKEVRFGLAEAVLLKGLFPEARFLFIRRKLKDAYLSYRSFNPRMDWYATWPRSQAVTAYSFARHWSRLNGEFPDAVEATGGMMIDYEALISGDVPLDKISQYLGVSIDPQALGQRVGQGSTRDGASISVVEAVQLWIGGNYGFSR